MYTHLYIYIHKYIYTYRYIYMYTYICIYIDTCIFIYLHMFMYLSEFGCIQPHIQKHTCMYIHIQRLVYGIKKPTPRELRFSGFKLLPNAKFHTVSSSASGGRVRCMLEAADILISPMRWGCRRMNNGCWKASAVATQADIRRRLHDECGNIKKLVLYDTCSWDMTSSIHYLYFQYATLLARVYECVPVW